MSTLLHASSLLSIELLSQISCISLILLAEPIVLVMSADGTLSGCSPNQRNFATLWTVPGELSVASPSRSVATDTLDAWLHRIVIHQKGKKKTTKCANFKIMFCVCKFPVESHATWELASDWKQLFVLLLKSWLISQDLSCTVTF